MGYGAKRKLRKALMPAMFICCGFAAAAEPVVIAALGDSLTQGHGLPEKDGFVSQLQRWLLDHGADVQLINAGVSGDTTAGGAARVNWTLTPEVDGMIVALGGNDLLRGIDPGVSRSNLEAILSAADASEIEVLLIGMQAPGNYGADYKQRFDSIYPDLAQQFGTLYAESFFMGLAASGDPAAARQFMQSDGIHPNAQGVSLIVEALGPVVLTLAREAAK